MIMQTIKHAFAPLDRRAMQPVALVRVCPMIILLDAAGRLHGAAQVPANRVERAPRPKSNGRELERHPVAIIAGSPEDTTRHHARSRRLLTTKTCAFFPSSGWGRANSDVLYLKGIDIGSRRPRCCAISHRPATSAPRSTSG